MRDVHAASQRGSNPVEKRRVKLCEFFWGHFAPSAARPTRRTDFASAVLANIPAVDIANIALVLFGLRGRIGGKSVGEYPADALQILRLRSMLRRERNEGAQYGGNADNPKHYSDTAALAVQG